MGMVVLFVADSDFFLQEERKVEVKESTDLA